jgi:hypothetical protein
LIEATINEFAHLAPTLADQRDHGHFSVSTSDDIGQEDGFTHSGLTEYADALATSAGK